MARPPTSLRTFLAAARRALAASAAQPRSAPPLTLVVGNESADLDSLCSALLLAYLRSHSPPHYALHVPVANLPTRADLALRHELAAVLRRAGLDAADLPTLADLPRDLDAAATRWLLVDHNVMTGPLAERFGRRVVGCVDHHADEGKVAPETADDPHIIRRCGSCASLVVEYTRDAWEALASASASSSAAREETARWNAQLALVALAPILMDTTNLTSPSKTTEADVRAVAFCESLVDRADVLYERGQYFDELSALKEDLSGFGYRDVLRKDYKQWTDGGLTLGTSSVVRGFDYLLARVGDRAALLEALRAWADERHLDLVTVLTVSHPEGRLVRELLVWARNERAAAAARAFEERHGGDLGLEPWRGGALDDVGSGDGGWRKCWRQTRIEHSRKQVAPMLREAMTETSKLAG